MIRRCVTTTYDVATGDGFPFVLEAVATARDNVVGVYCEVVTPDRSPSATCSTRLSAPARVHRTFRPEEVGAKCRPQGSAPADRYNARRPSIARASVCSSA